MSGAVDAYVNVYRQETHRVVMESCGRRRACGDNYGDIECPSCDAVVAPEGHQMRLGDKCWRCGAVIVAFVPYSQPWTDDPRKDES